VHIDLIPGFAAELVKSKADVIYASGAAGIRAAQQATATIPILGITQDMVGEGGVTVPATLVARADKVIE
jgi:putative ABC transport system substrate-binding protein